MWSDNRINAMDGWNARLIMIWKWLAVMLVLRVLWGILFNYPSYFPADFGTPFLVDREKDFHGIYRTSFYIHIVSSPIALIIGLFLVSSYSRRWVPRVHRILGRIQIAIVCLAVGPSGFVMSFYASGGIVSTGAFLFLSVLTGATALLGFRSALLGQIKDHQRWMWRCCILLSSAIVLRLLTMVVSPFGWEPLNLYRVNAWLSWLMPLMVLEFSNWLFKRASAGPRSSTT
jgi:hypothetical protein